MIPYGEEQIQKARSMGSPEHEILTRLLDTVGNGSGVKNMAAAADEYFLTPPAGSIYVVERVFINILDASAVDIDGWGGIAALVTGCKFEIRRQEAAASPAIVARDLTGGETLKDHIQLGRYARLDIQSDAGGCTVQAEYAVPTLRLDGDRGESLVFETQDSLVALVRQEVCVTGLICGPKNV
jgi:hypothetical protein